MSSLRDTERMQPDELPDELVDPTDHASEHVAPHPVPRISAHKTMELDTVKVADPALNSRNAKTMRVLRPPVVPSVDPGAGYAYDDLAPAPTKSPWMLIGGALALVVLVGAGVLFVSNQAGRATPAGSALADSPPEPSAQPTQASHSATDEPARAAAAPSAAPDVASASASAGAAPVPSPENPSAPKAGASPEPEPSPKAPTSKPAAPTSKPAAPTSKPAAPTSKPAAPKGKPDWEEWM